jgi:signal peptidase II
MKKPLVIGLIVAAVVVALDQFAKWWMLEVFLLPYRGTVEVLPFFDLIMVWNRGISFGLLAFAGGMGRWILMALAAGIIGVLIFWLRRITSVLLSVTLGLVIGGAIGNLVDRVRLGAVVDFIELHAGGYAFYVFNVADAAISIGVALLLWDAIFVKEDKLDSPNRLGS